MKSIILYLASAFLLAGSCSAQTSRIISGSTGFSVKFILGTSTGTFDAPTGKAVFDEKEPESASFDISVAANSFKTNNNTRDKDMKSEKYFYVDHYPQIRFKSSKVEKDQGRYAATGTLTIRDISKKVTLPFEAKKNADGTYTFTSTFVVNRLDYHVGEKDWKLKDDVTVTMKAIAK